MNVLYSLYQQLRKIPIMGGVVKGARDVYRHPLFEKKRLFHRDLQTAQKVAYKLFGEEGAQQVAHFAHSELFKKSFSFGNSGDFDVLMLYTAVRMLRPKIVVETGVASGRSSAAILQGLADNQHGTLYSIDLPQEYETGCPETYVTHEGNQELKGFLPKGKEPGWLVPDQLRDRWKLILGDSNSEIPKLLSQLEQIDIFYHDGDHSFESMSFEFTTLWPRLSPGGLLCSDDIDWNDAWKEFVARENPSNMFTYRHFGIATK